MKLVFYSATDIGPVRRNNQDSILADGDKGLFIVADGMGGHQGGEVASRLAVQIMSQQIEKIQQKQEVFLSTNLREACVETNKIIHNEGQKDLNLRGMGTTLCMLLVEKNGQSYIINIGDSRLYMEKDGQMWLLTEDHNFLTNQKKASFLSGDPEWEASSEDNVLTKSVGFFPNVDMDLFERKVEKKEKYLICSDGLSGFVPDQKIRNILTKCDLQDIPGECIKTALEYGSEDNISVIVIEVQ
ncbi:MAG: protein phosphatase 2C domain-containing protein [Bdellovibrionales bacterium]|nr:protein phosphatase 2C domain-containing protein [Bdellovibrionales bacterium]